MIEYLQKENAANTQRCAEGCLDFDMASLKRNTESVRGMEVHEQLCLETCYKKLTAGSDLFLRRNVVATKRINEK